MFKNKFYIVLCILFGHVFSNAQILSATYTIEKSEKENQYDIYLSVLEGSAKSTRDRAQFNSQACIVVSTGAQVEVVQTYNPIKDNQEYKGTDPITWQVSKPLIAPEADKMHDFFSFRPKLMPSAFYHDVQQGDKIKLFTIAVIFPTKEAMDVRLFKNGEDPDEYIPSMQGRNFSQGICIGGVKQLYKQ
ncbi:MAG: hypothetical protein RLZZ546_1828 [Bacteroidota bacterium]|jgi:hypothetical protein